MDIFTSQVYKYVDNNLCNVRFNEGVIGTLMKLKKKKIKSAIVTTSEKTKVYSVLERLNMIDSFACIIGRNDLKKLKPDCEAIDKALNIIGGDKILTAIVGDSYQVAFKDTISMHFAFEIVFELLRHNTKQAFIFGYFLYECNLVSEVDIKAGQNAGISTIWISSKENKNYHIHLNERELNPDFTINSFHELQRFF